MTWSAGCQSPTLVDTDGTPISALVLYPTDAPENETELGDLPLTAAADAAPAGGPHPLVIISHGKGGSHLVYRGLAQHLARHGYVVCLPEHPFDNRNNRKLTGSLEILANRPRHISIVADWMETTPLFAGHVDTRQIAVIGHSMGGYTALAAAGAIAWSGPNEVEGGEPDTVPITPDPRIRSLVLMAPATPWFLSAGALADIDQPILMYTGEKDQFIPSIFADIIIEGVPDREQVEHKVVEGAGHFSFLTPFPDCMCHATFAPSQDPEGFDRARFHGEMNAEILAFLQRTLPARTLDRPSAGAA